MLVNLSPEDQLCLLLARARFSPDAAKEPVARLNSAGWALLPERARANGLIPLIYHRLEALDFPGAPAQVRRKLTDFFGINAIRNEMLTTELASVLTRLGDEKIPVIPLKGVALAESLYGDIGLRTCADLDILIRPVDLQRSLRLLVSAGYNHAFAPPPSVRLLADYGRDCALLREDKGWVYPLQAHCGLIWGGPVERSFLAEIWSRASPRPFRNAPALALSPEDEFLYLAVHAARHGLSSFKWIVDLDWLVNRGNVNWHLVLNKVRTLGWDKAVGYSLSACAELLDTPIPEPLAGMPAIATARVRRSDAGPLEILRQTIFVVRLLPNFSQRLLFMATRTLIPTSADSNFLRLPSSLFMLYFIFRPCRLAFTALKWLIQASIGGLRGNPKPSTNG